MGLANKKVRDKEIKMKRIDYENGNISKSIIQAAIPMLVAQLLNLLYNIVDRIYIARIPGVGTTALGAVGLCFPIIVIITAFSNLFGTGGAPIFSIERGEGDTKRAKRTMSTSFTMLVAGGIVLMAIGLIFATPILRVFGASDSALKYAYPYIMIYMIGTIPSMISVGMNPFINAQGYATNGMISVVIGAAMNLILDPIFIFAFGLGIQGAAIATVISQTLSALYVLYFLRRKAEYKVRFLNREEIAGSGKVAWNIISLGTAGFIMQLTNSLVTICCNNVLGATGGDLYISVMTIISSIRQMVETPIYAITEGSSPIISYNYGAKRPERIKKAAVTMALLALAYTIIIWGVILLFPRALIRVFSDDATLFKDTIFATKIYFSAFIFMLLQYTGQTIFKALNKKTFAIFFSLFRKVILVVPLTYLLPYAFKMGTAGVFWAEPISNIIGGLACFITMLFVVIRELNIMKKEKSLSQPK